MKKGGNNENEDEIKIAVVLCARSLKNETISLMLEELFKGSPVKIILTGNEGPVCKARIVASSKNKDKFRDKLKNCGIEEKTVDIFIFEGCPLGPLETPPDYTPTIEILREYLKKDGIIATGNYKQNILPSINTENLILKEVKEFHVKNFRNIIPIISGIRNHIYYYPSQREGNYINVNEQPVMSYAHIYKFKKERSSKSSNQEKSSSQEKAVVL